MFVMFVRSQLACAASVLLFVSGAAAEAEETQKTASIPAPVARFLLKKVP